MCHSFWAQEWMTSDSKVSSWNKLFLALSVQPNQVKIWFRCIWTSVYCMCYQNIDSVCKHHWLIHTDLTDLDSFECRRQNCCQICNGSRLTNCWDFNISPTGRVSRYSGIKKKISMIPTVIHHSSAVQTVWWSVNAKLPFTV